MRHRAIESRVRRILEDNPATRDDDNLLMIEYCALVGYNVNRPFWAVMKDKTAPNRESVTRARRKLQEKFEDLRGTRKTRAKRAELEEEYREYART